MSGDYSLRPASEPGKSKRDRVREMVAAGLPDELVWREIADYRPDRMTDLERAMWRAEIETWRHRGPGRPRNTKASVGPRYRWAEAELVAKGRPVTDASIAEKLGIEPRTVQGWRDRGLIPNK